MGFQWIVVYLRASLVHLNGDLQHNVYMYVFIS